MCITCSYLETYVYHLYIPHSSSCVHSVHALTRRATFHEAGSPGKGGLIGWWGKSGGNRRYPGRTRTSGVYYLG